MAGELEPEAVAEPPAAPATEEPPDEPPAAEPVAVAMEVAAPAPEPDAYGAGMVPLPAETIGAPPAGGV